MEPVSLEYSTSLFLFNSFYYGYTFFCIACLAGRLIVSENYKGKFINGLAAVNLCFALASVLSILLLSYELYQLYFPSSDFEQFAFYENRLAGVPVSMIFSFLPFLAGLVFFFKKLRTDWILSLFVLLAMRAERIIMWTTATFGRDYLPSSWSTEYSQAFPIWEILFYGFISVLIYLWLAKRKNLPYPSAYSNL